MKVSTVVLEGDLRRALVEEARRWGVDRIFVGTHGRNGEADQCSPGGLIASVVASSPCSVEVARSSMRAAAGAFVTIARAPIQAPAARGDGNKPLREERYTGEQEPARLSSGPALRQLRREYAGGNSFMPLIPSPPFDSRGKR